MEQPDHLFIGGSFIKTPGIRQKTNKDTAIVCCILFIRSLLIISINLLLSSFDTMAKQAGVVLSVDACVPEILPVSGTELCPLLSSGLENAITAVSAAPIPEKKRRRYKLRCMVYKEKLLLSVRNPCEGDIVLQAGLPQTNR